MNPRVKPATRRRQGRTLVVTLLALALLPGACQKKGGTPSALEDALNTAKDRLSPGGEEFAPEPGRAGGRPLAMPATPGVYFSLSGADGAAATAEPAEPARGEPLSQAELQRRLAQLPGIEAGQAVRAAFRFRPGPTPPAIPGADRRQAFPPESETGAMAPEALEERLSVLRRGPEGEEETAPRVSVTFNRPMVPLTSQEALADRDLPVTIEPEPDGQWRWLGTRTLVFEPEGGRLPKATMYTITVPAGVEDATGMALGEATRWELTLPPLAITAVSPEGDGPYDVDPLILVRFNQRVEAEDLLDGSLVAQSGSSRILLRRATVEELEADPAAKAIAGEAPQGTWLALKPGRALPRGADVDIVLRAGAPSAEGPLTRDEDQTRSFRTYGPLELARLSCGGSEEVMADGFSAEIEDCPPALGSWSIAFSNPLDPKSITVDDLEVEPPLKNLSLSIYEHSLVVGGLSAGRTEYTVRVPEGLKDTFGQSLAREARVTIQTGDLSPALLVPGDRNVVLDPAAGGVLEIFSVNNETLRVVLKRVGPEDWAAFNTFVDRDGRNLDQLPGTPISDEVVEVEAETDSFAPLRVDLGPALTDGKGMVAVFIAPTEPDPDSWLNRPQLRWVQATGLGFDTALEAGTGRVWVTDLADGTPIEGAEVRVGDGGPARTDEDGLAVLPPFATRDQEVPVVVSRGADAVMQSLWSPSRPTDPEALWFVFDDRGLYRPGEEAHIKGWVRQQNPGPRGDLGPVEPAAEGVRFKLTDSSGNTALEGEWEVSEAGGFDGVLALPANMPTGYTNLELRLDGDDLEDRREHYHSLNIAEFRRPEFEVKVQPEQPEWLQGETAFVEAMAAYYSGGALSNAAVDWTVSGQPTTYSPPGHEGFQFGRWVPWWFDGPMAIDAFGHPRFAVDSAKTLPARTDGGGRHRLAIALEGVNPLSAVSLNASASVQDLNRQTLGGSASFLVHPAEAYVGLRSEQWFAEAGAAFEVEAIVAAIDGDLLVGRPIEIVAERIEYRWTESGQSEEVAEKAGSCSLTSAAEPVVCELSFEEGGEYRVTAETSDARGRPNQSQIRLWVPGAGWDPYGGRERDRRLQAEPVTLIPDKDSYLPGDTARILIKSPFAPAEALVSVRRSGTLSTERLSLDASGGLTYELPIEDGHTPNVFLSVTIVGSKPRLDDEGTPSPSLPKQPALASGSIRLPVPPKRRELTVEAAPERAMVDPGAKTRVDLAVRDADGDPVAGAELALVVVDEAVLALTGYQLPDPLAAFYPERDSGVSEGHLRELLQLADPGLVADQAMAGNPSDAPQAAMDRDDSIAESAGMNMLAQKMMAGGRGGGGGGDGQMYSMEERSDFNPLAAFVPEARTDASGEVSLEIELPDNVTRYRVMAVATDGEARFGKGEGSLTAQLPLTARPSAPRFLNFGDRFEMPVIVQNLGAEPQEVDVLLRVDNLGLEGGWTDPETGLSAVGRRVAVPAEGRVEVRFPASAEMAGTAVYQAAAFGAESGDAVRAEIPVFTPVTTEAFATYGEIDEGAVRQPVERPDGVIDAFGGLELTTTSTALGNLTDAFLYLNRYPYDCAEQVASRVIANVALKDVLRAFGAPELPTEAEVDAFIREDLARLDQMQSQVDGGWDWWKVSEPGDPVVTIHVAHALARAEAKGYDLVQAGIDIDGMDTYLRTIRSKAAEHDRRRWRLDKTDEAWIDLLHAEALYVRRLFGDEDGDQVGQLAARLDRMPLEARAWLLSAAEGLTGLDEARAAIRDAIAESVTEEAGTVQFSTAVDETDRGVFLRSERRTDAIVLDALMADQPQSDLIAKGARSLLEHRVKGRWSTTQENAWVLVALDRYFRQYESETPDFVARAWLDGRLAMETAFVGRSADRGQSLIPMAELPEGEAADLILGKEGPGRLYYRLGLRYAPVDLKITPMERGFSVTRVYEAVDDPGDVRRTADGGWEIKAGSRVRVRLGLAAVARRYQVALVDPLPAGLEALNPDLATTEVLPPDPEAKEDGGDRPYGGWRWSWYDHESYRDDRVEVFAQGLDAGDYSYTYLARATTPGTFTAPPVKAEEMYHPETFARGASETVTVR